jgi:exopolysaccharide biosynthesis polyprenyl glycosylphosphotransferase
MLNYKRAISFWLLVLPNLALFYVSLWLTIKIWYPNGLPAAWLRDHYLHFTVIHLISLVTFFSFRLFDRETFRRYTTLFFSLLTASMANLFIAIGYFYFQPVLSLTPRRFLLAHVLISFLLILSWNLIIKAFVFRKLIQPVYLFAFNEELNNLEKEIAKQDYLGFKVMGHIATEELRNLPTKSGSLVIFPDKLHNSASLTDAIFEVRKSGVEFFNHNYFYEKLLRRIYTPSLDQIWFLQNISYSRKILYWLLKGLFDFILGLIAFVIFAVTFPVIALLIKATSTGPVLFKQQRVGLNGKEFTIYKYRTMTGNSENQWTSENDSRITSFGKLLRLTRLDELPQSINLILGNMSIVGPRPEQVGIVAELKKQIPFYEERHIVKPGITGWAQLNIYAGTLEETRVKLEYDLYYVKHQSIWFDLEILAKTVYNMLTLQGK